MNNNSNNNLQEDYSPKFLLEEYKNIAATHDKLRDNIAHIFNYFLILNAFPFTVVGIIFKDKTFNLFDAPLSLHLLFLVVSIADFFMALSIAEARLVQYMYARTVNSIRKYFADMDSNLLKYLYLPTSIEVPKWEKLGFVGWQVLMVRIVGALLCAYGGGEILWSLVINRIIFIRAILYMIVFALYYFLSWITLRKLKITRQKIHEKELVRLKSL